MSACDVMPARDSPLRRRLRTAALALEQASAVIDEDVAAAIASDLWNYTSTWGADLDLFGVGLASHLRDLLHLAERHHPEPTPAQLLARNIGREPGSEREWSLLGMLRGNHAIASLIALVQPDQHADYTVLQILDAVMWYGDAGGESPVIATWLTELLRRLFNEGPTPATADLAVHAIMRALNSTAIAEVEHLQDQIIAFIIDGPRSRSSDANGGLSRDDEFWEPHLFELREIINALPHVSEATLALLNKAVRETESPDLVRTIGSLDTVPTDTTRALLTLALEPAKSAIVVAQACRSLALDSRSVDDATRERALDVLDSESADAIVRLLGNEAAVDRSSVTPDREWAARLGLTSPDAISRIAALIAGAVENDPSSFDADIHHPMRAAMASLDFVQRCRLNDPILLEASESACESGDPRIIKVACQIFRAAGFATTVPQDALLDRIEEGTSTAHSFSELDFHFAAGALLELPWTPGVETRLKAMVTNHDDLNARTVAAQVLIERLPTNDVEDTVHEYIELTKDQPFTPGDPFSMTDGMTRSIIIGLHPDAQDIGSKTDMLRRLWFEDLPARVESALEFMRATQWGRDCTWRSEEWSDVRMTPWCFVDLTLLDAEAVASRLTLDDFSLIVARILDRSDADDGWAAEQFLVRLVDASRRSQQFVTAALMDERLQSQWSLAERFGANLESPG